MSSTLDPVISGQQTPVAAERRSRGPSRLVRAAVVEATVAELAEHGYGTVTLERIARRAGVAKTTLYRRWGTKEALVLEAMLERAGTRISLPDTGSLRQDLLEFAETAATNAASPEVSAMARAVVAGAPHDSALAAAVRDFWTQRLALDAYIVERAIDRGEVVVGTDALRVIEAVIGPIHLRLLLTGEPVDRDFLDGVVDTVIDGIAPRPSRRA